MKNQRTMTIGTCCDDGGGGDRWSCLWAREVEGWLYDAGSAFHNLIVEWDVWCIYYLRIMTDNVARWSIFLEIWAYVDF